jgi:hypothetical protein
MAACPHQAIIIQDSLHLSNKAPAANCNASALTGYAVIYLFVQYFTTKFKRELPIGE